jgi:hypothetical protein
VGEVQIVLDSLTKLHAEQQYLTQVMGLWAHALEAGYDSDDIQTFTFRDAYLTPSQARENKKLLANRLPPMYSGKTHHNAVRLKNNNVVAIPLIAAPVPPDHMKCTVTEKM